jgi:hypothetical protein
MHALRISATTSSGFAHRWYSKEILAKYTQTINFTTYLQGKGAKDSQNAKTLILKKRKFGLYFPKKWGTKHWPYFLATILKNNYGYHQLYSNFGWFKTNIRRDDWQPDWPGN